MKKVLGLVGSPRKGGNTDLLVREVLAGAESQGAATRIIYLSDRNIRECDGCHACWRNKPCSKKDDMNLLYEEIAANDGFVFGTPVYWYGPTALMKLFIDRCVYFNCPANRNQIRGKTAAVVIPFEEETLETAQPVAAFFTKSLRYLELDCRGELLVPGVTRKGEVAGNEKVLREAQILGQKLGST